jgi:flagellar protein FlgJ
MEIDTTPALLRPVAPARGGDGIGPHSHGGDAALRRVAQDLEASFLAEMLKHSGLGGAGGALAGDFGGGTGEAQFSSFLTQEHARLVAERGGIGLAEGIYRALIARGGQ